MHHMEGVLDVRMSCAWETHTISIRVCKIDSVSVVFKGT